MTILSEPTGQNMVAVGIRCDGNHCAECYEKLPNHGGRCFAQYPVMGRNVVRAESVGSEVEGLRARAQRLGWVFDGQRDFCGGCRTAEDLRMRDEEAGETMPDGFRAAAQKESGVTC